MEQEIEQVEQTKTKKSKEIYEYLIKYAQNIFKSVG